MNLSNLFSNSFPGRQKTAENAPQVIEKIMEAGTGIEPVFTDLQSAPENRVFPNKTRRFGSAGLRKNRADKGKTHRECLKQHGGQNDG